jgi:predicted ATPase
LLISRGKVMRGVAIIQSAVPRMGAAGSVAESPAFLAVSAHGRGLVGEIESGMTAIDDALERSERTGERWCAAELLRIKGELSLAPGAPDHSAAEEYFRRALDIANGQGTLSWELRIGLSLCRLRVKQGRGDEGRRLLAAIHDRFSEGFGTADLVAAKQLLNAREKGSG